MRGIREFTRGDIANVADLHRDVMDMGPVMTEPLLGRYREWLSSTFLDNPMRTEGLENLVYRTTTVTSWAFLVSCPGRCRSAGRSSGAARRPTSAFGPTAEAGWACRWQGNT